MQLTLERTGQLFAPNTVLARSLWARSKGLLGRRAFNPGEALILPRCSQVHMFFMRFPIDVLFCSDSYEVLEFQENLKPWRFSKLVWGAKSVIELPAGTVRVVGVRKGDRVMVS